MCAFFGDALKREVTVHHSTKLALLGEKVCGMARGYGNVLYVDFAYGLGCSIMIDGRIYGGKRALAGEIGYFYSCLEEFNSSSIKPYELGCLEEKISGKALQERARTAVREDPDGLMVKLAGGQEERVSGKTVFDAYRLGDAAARKILEEAFAYFNMALSNAINLVAPQLVILGGGFSRAGDVLIDLVAKALGKKVLMMPRVAVSELGNRASLIGGLQYLIDHTDLLVEC